MCWRDVLLFLLVAAFWLIVAFLLYRAYWVWRAVRVIALVEAVRILADIEERDYEAYKMNGGDYLDRIARYGPEWKIYLRLWIWDVEKLKG